MQNNQDINTRAMLVNLSVSVFNPTRLDRKVTDEVTTMKQADRDAGDYRKRIVPKAVIDPVLRAANAVYLDHKAMTSPWADGGTRLLCIDIYEQYADKISGGKRIFEREVDRFLRQYEDIREKAPIRMGATYNPADFPPVDEARARFGIRTEWTPLPNGSDFRLHLNDTDLSELRSSVDERVAAAVEESKNDLAKRLVDRLSHISERLAKPENIFRDSMIEGLRELLDMIPRMMITPDPVLEVAVAEAKARIAGHSPDNLRDEELTRASAKLAADEILKKMMGASYKGLAA